LRIWVAASYDAGLSIGGWAFVRDGAEPLGWAGGERRTTRARMTLAGFAAALKDLPPGEALKVVAPETDARILHALAKPPAAPPQDNPDLRAALAKALANRTWTVAVGDPAGATPAAFAAAWADLAREKARSGGAFTAAIPKTNLAKVKGLGGGG
jgi:hypothetical protein